jgi:putative oxidoreductase
MITARFFACRDASRAIEKWLAGLRPEGYKLGAMEKDDLVLISPMIGMTARILFTLIFFLSGITHFTDLRTYVNLMPAAIPGRAFWVVTSALVELVGANLILFNYRPRLGGWLIVLFLVPVTIVVHGTAMIADPSPVMRAVNVSFFLKGLAMIACALFITQFGVKLDNGDVGKGVTGP